MWVKFNENCSKGLGDMDNEFRVKPLDLESA